MWQKNKGRVISLDLLRVLSMYLVVVSHYIYHGIKTRGDLQDYYSFQSFMGAFNYLSMNALYIISCVAVNCFVMISGYFLIVKMSYRWKGIMSIWIETAFYSIAFLLLSSLFGKHVNMNDVMHSVFPIWGKRYWFMTYYLGLMLIAPLISRAVANMEEKEYRVVVLVLLVMNFQYLYGEVFGGFATLLWFSFLFVTGGYIKKFGCPSFVIQHKGVLLLGMWSLLTLMAWAINLMKDTYSLMSTSYHGPVYFLSLFVFIYFVFSEIPRRWVGIISKVAPYTLAVYLIHANGFWGGHIWNIVIPDTFILPMIFYCLGSCLLVFACCILIDMIRGQLFRQLRIEKLIDMISVKLPQL